MTANELISNKAWLHGPDYLSMDSQEWPQTRIEELLSDDPEVKVTCKAVITKPEGSQCIQALMDRYSDWISVKRAITWVLAVKNVLMRKRQPSGELTTEEIEMAEKAIITYFGRKHFSDDIWATQYREVSKDWQIANSKYCSHLSMKVYCRLGQDSSIHRCHTHFVTQLFCQRKKELSLC